MKEQRCEVCCWWEPNKKLSEEDRKWWRELKSGNKTDEEMDNEESYGKCLKSIFSEDVSYKDSKNLPMMVSRDGSGYMAFLETHKNHICGEFEKKEAE